LIALANHLWQSTLFALTVGSLTLLLRKNSARVRYLLWLAASAKFLVPFALLTAAGAQIAWSPGPVQGTAYLSTAGQIAAQITQFGGEGATPLVAHAGDSGDVALVALGTLWALGTLAVVARLFARWRLVRHARRESTQMRLAFVTPVRSASSQLEPAVVGILRPVLLLPKGIEQRLTPEQMSAVLAHERCHVAWRDNLAAALHMLVEALFWFHPLIWWLGTRLVDERERACDEQVLADGHAPETYAEGILRVCEHYLESRLTCVAGVSGGNLRHRIEDIMGNRLIERLSGVRKLVITVAASATIAAPVAVGVLSSPHARAQARAADTEVPRYGNASIQRAPAAVALAGAATPAPTGEAMDFGQQGIHVDSGSFVVDSKTHTAEYKDVLIRENDITVQADRAHAAGLTFDNSHWTLENNVRVQSEQRGSVHSAKAVVEFRNNHIVKVTVDGSPAEFEQKSADSDQITRGHAAEIVYDVNDGTVWLTQDAWLSDGRNEISSGLLVYNIRQQRLRGSTPGGADGRTQVTVSPDGKIEARKEP
jgi:lipopolysaccharide transport protein LptA